MRRVISDPAYRLESRIAVGMLGRARVRTRVAVHVDDGDLSFHVILSASGEVLPLALRGLNRLHISFALIL